MIVLISEGLKKKNVEFQRSNFSDFSSIQKWKIRNKIVLYETINQYNYEAINPLIENKIKLNNNQLEYNYLFMQIFKNEDIETHDEINIIEELLIQYKNNKIIKCKNLNQKLKQLKDKKKSLSIIDDDFYNDLISNEISRYNNSIEIDCFEIEYEIFNEIKFIKKYNFYLIALIINLLVYLSLFLIITFYNEYKK